MFDPLPDWANLWEWYLPVRLCIALICHSAARRLVRRLVREDHGASREGVGSQTAKRDAIKTTPVEKVIVYLAVTLLPWLYVAHGIKYEFTRPSVLLATLSGAISIVIVALLVLMRMWKYQDAHSGYVQEVKRASLETDPTRAIVHLKPRRHFPRKEVK